MSDNSIEPDDDAEEASPGRPDELPATIQPGQLGFTFWSQDDDGSDRGEVVVLTWDGQTEVEWYQDISMEMDGLSPMSSAPFCGTAGWPEGRDVAITYSSSDFGMVGEDVLAGAAPIGANGDTRDLQVWTQFARWILGFV